MGPTIPCRPAAEHLNLKITFMKLRAADYGNDDAAFQLGMAYETGYYLRQSCDKAAHWVKVAAEAGNAAAAYNLGLRYREGDGVPVDDSAAEHWLRVASTQKYSPAKLALTSMR